MCSYTTMNRARILGTRGRDYNGCEWASDNPLVLIAMELCVAIIYTTS